ncbi:MAG TPA: hypothetical protein VH330_11905 [Candidatus Udaeobacter sp.]|jgi:hypothetical protein
MKKSNITFGTILLVVSGFSLSLAVKPARDSRHPTTFTQIDVPGASLTIANSINPRGDIVGPYFDSDGNGHSFLLSNGAFTSIVPKRPPRRGIVVSIILPVSHPLPVNYDAVEIPRLS